MPLFKKNQRYQVSRRSDYIQVVALLDGSQMECNLTVDSTASQCLENVLQRLDIRDGELFGLRYVAKSGQFRWLDPDRSIKKQLDKHAESQVVCLAVFHYIERAYALRDEPSRYHYYLQLKSDVLECNLVCSLEQAILLAGYALQAEYQNYLEAQQSEDYIKEVETLDTTLLPRTLVADYKSSALADIAEHIVSSHMSLCGLNSNLAEISYIHLAEQLEGYGVEYTKALTESGEEIYLGNSHSGIIIRRLDGHIKQEFKRSQITELTVNKKALCIHTHKKKLSAKFLLDDAEAAKYVYKVSLLQQNFHRQSHDKLLLSDSELGFSNDGVGPITTHMVPQLSNQSTPTREKAIDVVPERKTSSFTEMEPMQSPPDLIEGQGHLFEPHTESDYATMKFHPDPVAKAHYLEQQQATAQASRNSIYGLTNTPMLEQLHKHDMLHRSMTALHRESLDTPEYLHNSHPARSHIHYGGSVENLVSYSGNRSITFSSHNLTATGQSAQPPTVLPSYRTSPDYDTVMRQRAQYVQVERPPLPDPRTSFARHAVLSQSQPDISETEPLYANIQQYVHQVSKHYSEVQLNHLYSGEPLQAPRTYPVNSTPDIMSNLNPQERSPGGYTESPDIIRRLRAETVPQHIHHSQTQPILQDHLQPNINPLLHSQTQTNMQTALPAPLPAGQGLYKSFDNLAELCRDDSLSATGSVRSRQSQQSQRSSHLNTPHGTPQGTPRSTNRSRRSGGRSSQLSAASNHSGGSSVAQTTLPETASPTVSRRSTQDERLMALEEKLRSGVLAAEYESLLQKTQPADCRVALRPENASRNRFPNVLPYEETRVRLIATPNNPHGYINASHVKMRVGKESLSYIATQNPLPETVADFWHLIWAHDVSIITMVTKLEENRVLKCPRYWPKAAGQQNTFSINDLRVTLQNSASSPNFTTSCLIVLKTSTKERRTLWHIQYTDWHPKTGCPEDVHGFLALLDELNSVRLHIQMENRKERREAPVCLVHCSTGAGRSAVLILSDVMRKSLEHYEKVSVADTLKELREQRMYMVQTIAQYEFVHQVLVHYLRGVRLI